jgi:hypothetical protein
VHEEVLKDMAAVKTFGALKERDGDRHLAVGRLRQLKGRIQGNGGFRKKSAATRRGMIRRAIRAWRKGHCRQGQGKDKGVPRTQKGRAFAKNRRKKPVGINGIRDRDLKKQPCLRKERTSGRVFGKIIGLQIVRIRKTSDWTL